jgi:hypothetical protein
MDGWLKVTNTRLEMVRAGKDDQPRDQGVAGMQTGARSAVAISSLAVMRP